MSRRALRLLREIQAEDESDSQETWYHISPTDDSPGEVVRWLVSLLEQRIEYRKREGLEPDDITDE